MFTMAEEKKKIGWAFNPPVIRAIDELMDRLPKGGLKAVSVEAALLMFFEASPDLQLQYINRMRQAEVEDRVEDVVREAVSAGATPSSAGAIGRSPSRSVAAKFAKPTTRGVLTKPSTHGTPTKPHR